MSMMLQIINIQEVTLLFQMLMDKKLVVIFMVPFNLNLLQWNHILIANLHIKLYKRDILVLSKVLIIIIQIQLHFGI